MRNAKWRKIDFWDVCALVIASLAALLAVHIGVSSAHGFGAVMAVFFGTLWLVEMLYNYVFFNKNNE